VISLRGVSKRYVKYDDQPMLVNALRLRTRTRRSSLVALRAIDLEVDAGESVGVLGRNGAGKSTLLQLLSGVTAPTTGVVRVRGKVAPLISVGVGFHPELTGRENVYVNGTILGMSGAEIDQRLDAIVDFAEVEAFIDTPVKFYSSGMFVRLGFAVAVAADPDILLVDEVLAVGDFPFQMKCFARMQEIRERGTTIVVVTHNINVIRGFCDRGLVLNEGGLVFDGPTFDAISTYYAVAGQVPSTDLDEEVGGREALEIESLELLDRSGKATLHIDSGDQATVRLRVRAFTDIAKPFVGMTIASERGVIVYTDTNRMTPFPALAAGESATYDISLPMTLAGGGYRVTSSVHALDGMDSTQLDRATPVTFFVSGRGLVSGVVDLGATFTRGGA
jgi:ABC-2 type transport system ATP-binding protein